MVERDSWRRIPIFFTLNSNSIPAIPGGQTFSTGGSTLGRLCLVSYKLHSFRRRRPDRPYFNNSTPP